MLKTECSLETFFRHTNCEMDINKIPTGFVFT